MSDTKVEVVRIDLCYYKGKIAEINYGCGEYHYFEIHGYYYLGGGDIHPKKRIGRMFRPIRVQKSYQEKLADKIAQLQAENEKLQAENTELEKAKNLFRSQCARLGADNIDLQEKLKLAVEGLEFYANKTNYDTTIDFTDSITHNFISRDLDHEEHFENNFIGGKLARQILAKLKETK